MRLMVTMKAKRSRRCAGDTRLRRRELHHEKANRKFLKGRDMFVSVLIGSWKFVTLLVGEKLCHVM